MDFWTQARDAERFASECRVVLGMMEQKMERYEAMLGRFRDVCALHGGMVSGNNWQGWTHDTLYISGNFPSIRGLLVAPRVSPEGRAAFERQLRDRDRDPELGILTTRTNADSWCPVWSFSTWGIKPKPIPRGDDLMAETPMHPSFEAAFDSTFGWVTGHPAHLPGQDDGLVTGFWFVVPLRPLNFTNWIRWKNASETEAAAATRRDRMQSERVTGLLAAFIGGDLFTGEFNDSQGTVRVQLFTAPEPDTAKLINPGLPPPLNARFVRDQVMRWYGRKWLARCHITPVFEAGSLRYRSWLVYGIGSLLSLGMAATVGWQTRGRLRERALAGQLREALGRQERLSRDLHDGTLQSVYGVGLGLQRAQRLLEKNPARTGGQLADTALALQRVVGELRSFIRKSDPTTRAEVPLGEALAGWLAHLRCATEMELQFEMAPDADRGLTPAQSLQLLNIAREALSNSVRHSGARRVQVLLKQAGGSVRLEVMDDGCGFDAVTAQASGHGLKNLAARVREIAGRHRWESDPGQGARLVVEVQLLSPGSNHGG